MESLAEYRGGRCTDGRVVGDRKCLDVQVAGAEAAKLDVKLQIALMGCSNGRRRRMRRGVARH